MSCWYILKTNHLLQHHLEIFSPTLQVVLLFMFSFVVLKLLGLIRYCLFLFQKHLIVVYVRVFCLYFPLEVLSSLTFRSLINLSLFLYMVLENVLISFFYMQLSSFSQNHLLKRLTFLHCVFSPTFLRLIGHKCMGLLLDCLFCSVDLYVHFCVSVRQF